MFACDRTAELKHTTLKDVDDRAAMTRELTAMEIQLVICRKPILITDWRWVDTSAGRGRHMGMQCPWLRKKARE